MPKGRAAESYPKEEIKPFVHAHGAFDCRRFVIPQVRQLASISKRAKGRVPRVKTDFRNKLCIFPGPATSSRRSQTSGMSYTR